MQGEKGYRLHIKRLQFASDDSVIRTFKFPLTSRCDKKKNFFDLPGELIEAIKHDDLYLRGPSNLVDYLRFKDKEIYSVIDFWIDSLRAGVVFMPSAASLLGFVTRIKKGESDFNKLFKAADVRILSYFQTDKFIEEVIEKGEIRANRSKNSFISTLNKILKKGLSSDEKKEAEKFIYEIVDSFFDENGNLKVIGSGNQNKIWLDKFKLDKTAIDLSFNLTFYIFPEISVDIKVPVTGENLLQIFNEIIAKRINWLKNHGFSQEEIKNFIDKTIGLSDNFNAFSNYFGKSLKLFKSENRFPENILKLLNKVYPISDSKVTSLLFWLSEKAKFLDYPTLSVANGWHDYRTLVGGKLLSWWTNHKNRQVEQLQQIEDLEKQLPNLYEFIKLYPKDKSFIDNELKGYRVEIVDLLKEVEKVIEEPEDIFDNFEKYNFLESLIGQLRQRLNEYFQKYVKDSVSSTLEDNKYLKDFWKIKIYKPRSFYGYAQREELKKIVETTISTIKQGISFTKILLNNLLSFVNYDYVVKETEGINREIKPDIGLRRFLEALRKKIKDDKLNTKKFKDFYIEILKTYLPSEDTSYLVSEGKLNKYTFYKSSYSTSTQKVIDLPSLEFSQEAKNIIEKINKFLLSFSDDQILKDPQLLLDFIETAKIVIARMFRWMDQEKEWNLDKFNFEIFPAAAKFINQLGTKRVKTPMLRFIIMSQVFSEFRGAATTYSKKYITVKWNVQVVGSDSKFKLVITPKDNIEVEELIKKIINKNSSEILKQVNWNVLINSKTGERRKLIILKDKQGNFKLSTEKVNNNLLQICTSKHHLQFLERLIYKPPNWRNVNIQVSEPSLIVEETYRVSWDLEKEVPKVEFLHTNKPRLYYALPFKFKIKRGAEKSKLSQIKFEFKANPKEALKKYHFLGADIGEYGIAWSIVQIDEDQKEIFIKDWGFEYDKQIKKIQDEFKEIQQKARLGLFLESSTLLAKLRENAIGYLRNKLHDKLINYSGHIVYEANISGFEEGVGRITKIYDSVKRADVGNHPDMAKDVGKKLAKHIWGLKAGGKDNSPGWQVSAYATSYICTSCGQSIYNLGEDKDEWYKVKSLNNSIHLFHHPVKSVQIYIYKERDIKDIEKYKDIIRYARMFARPPLVKSDSDGYPAVVEHFIIKPKVFTSDKLVKIKNRRGNSSIFVCPFDNCNAVTDADVQAAVVIAIRGYFYAKEYYLNKNDKPFSENKDKLYKLTEDLIQSCELKGKLDFIYYKGKNGKNQNR